MKILFFVFVLFISANCFAQTSYEDSVKAFQKNYVQTHEVVQGSDKEKIHFFEVNKNFRVTARFEPATKSDWLTFKTSGKQIKVFKVYGTANFKINNESCQLTIYQSQELMLNPDYKNYLFLPFTDATTGKESYVAGRYLDLTTGDIKNNQVILDFNKAYNPYCAYVTGVYNCPIPPKENALSIAIKAGEKNFEGSH